MPEKIFFRVSCRKKFFWALVIKMPSSFHNPSQGYIFGTIHNRYEFEIVSKYVTLRHTSNKNSINK